MSLLEQLALKQATVCSLSPTQSCLLLFKHDLLRSCMPLDAHDVFAERHSPTSAQQAQPSPPHTLTSSLCPKQDALRHVRVRVCSAPAASHSLHSENSLQTPRSSAALTPTIRHSRSLSSQTRYSHVELASSESRTESNLAAKLSRFCTLSPLCRFSSTRIHSAEARFTDFSLHGSALHTRHS